MQRISPHHGPLVLDIFSFRWISFWSTIHVCFYVIEELLPVFSDKSFLEKQSLIEAERRFFKERNKEIVDKLMKNTPKEELDSVEFKVSVTVYIFIIKSTYENVVKVSLWADSTATCPDKSRNYIIMLKCLFWNYIVLSHQNWIYFVSYLYVFVKSEILSKVVCYRVNTKYQYLIFMNHSWRGTSTYSTLVLELFIYLIIHIYSTLTVRF